MVFKILIAAPNFCLLTLANPQTILQRPWDYPKEGLNQTLTARQTNQARHQVFWPLWFSHLPFSSARSNSSKAVLNPSLPLAQRLQSYHVRRLLSLYFWPVFIAGMLSGARRQTNPICFSSKQIHLRRFFSAQYQSCLRIVPCDEGSESRSYRGDGKKQGRSCE